MNRATFAATALAAVVVLGAFVWRPGGRAAADAAPPDAVRSVAADRPIAVGAPTPHADTSLRGASWDGEVRLDAAGRVVPDLGLRRRFDHALALAGERSLPAIRAVLAAQLAAELPAPSAAEALALFDRYLAYLAAVDADPRAQHPDAARRLAALIALRRAHLGETMADGFFADEERLAAHGIARRDVAGDATLEESERARRLAALDAALPPALRAARDDATGAAQVQALDARLALSDADAATRHRARAAQFGEAAAQRLALLDAQRADWDVRVAAYLRERDRLRLDPAQADGPQSAAFVQLRARHFDAAGQRRIASLEAVGALPPRG